MPAMLFHILYDACQAIPYIMPCAPDHTIYHAHLVIPLGHTIYPAYPPGHTVNHDMSSRSYHITCHACQAISYTMPCPSGPTIYHAMPARPYHIPCYARQTMLYTTPCPPGHTYKTIPYSIPWPPGHTIYHLQCLPGLTIYHAMSQCHTIYHAMHARPCHIPCHACQTMPAMHCLAMPYTMLCLARPCPIPCYAR